MINLHSLIFFLRNRIYFYLLSSNTRLYSQSSGNNCGLITKYINLLVGECDVASLNAYFTTCHSLAPNKAFHKQNHFLYAHI